MGLGDIRVSSFLGQPLEAQIEILGAERVESSHLLVKIVSKIEAESLGVELLYSPNKFYVSIQSDPSGLPIIRLFSRKPITEPYTDILILLEWPTGSMYREFAVLLDLPVLNSRSKSNVETKSQDVPSFETEGKSAVYRVQFGDTFSAITSHLSRELKLNQNELADWLVINNPHAFQAGDINKLNAGVSLELPGAEYDPKLETIDVNNLSSDLNSGSKSNEKSSFSKNDGEKPVGVLRLSNSTNSPSESGGEIRSINEKLDGTQELLSLVIKENEDLKKRVKKLESSEYISTLKDLIYTQSEQIEALKIQIENLQGDDLTLTKERGKTKTSEVFIPEKSLSLSQGVDSPNNLETVSSTQVLGIDTLAEPEFSVIPWVVYFIFIIISISFALFLVYTFLRRRGSEESDEKYVEFNQYRATQTQSEIEDKTFVGAITSSDLKNEKKKRTVMDIIEEQQREKASARHRFERFTLVEKDKEEYNEDYSDDGDPEGKVSKEIVDKFNRESNIRRDIAEDESLADQGFTSGFERSDIHYVDHYEDEIESLDIDLVMDDEVTELLSMAEIYCKAHRYDDAIEIIKAQQKIDPDPRLEEALKDIEDKINK